MLVTFAGHFPDIFGVAAIPGAGLVQCPKRVSENHAHTLLIFQAACRDDILTETAYFPGRSSL